MRKFDLNIEEILENWDISHAVREIIANALDEQKLTNTNDIKIFKDNNGSYHIKDFGRGLNYDHFTQNENKEKIDTDGIIGKFGIGLKDALATFDRHNIEIKIISKYGIFTINKAEKQGFDNITTLHVYSEHSLDTNFIGTEFILSNIKTEDIEKAKNMFLLFSGDITLDETKYGTIIDKGYGTGYIYINGVKVAEEENFLFSYNITKLNSTINKALNRERVNVGRSAYTNSIKSILLDSINKNVMEQLSSDFQNYTYGTLHDELKWIDIQEHAIKILNKSGNVIFSTTNEISSSPDLIDEAHRSGYTIINIPENLKDKVQNNIDLDGEQIREFDYFKEERNENFEFDFISPNKLTLHEKNIYETIPNILNCIGGKPYNVKEILISETMQSDDYSYCEADGLFLSHENKIVIKRSILSDKERFIGVLLHELAHAKSGYTDITREFENELTNFLGIIGNKLILTNSNETLQDNNNIEKEIFSKNQDKSIPKKSFFQRLFS